MSRRPEPTNGYLDGEGVSPYGARADHNHDASYAASTHNHDSIYAAKTHTHPGLGKTVEISVADWNGGTSVEKSVAGVTADGMFAYIVDPADQSIATTAMLSYTTRAAGKITFGCTTTPTAAIHIVVLV